MNRIIGSCLLLCGTLVTKSQEKPNIVLFIADDVSRDDIGCYGNTQVKTPHIDRLAASGIKFTNMFLTASSSSPSRNSIITGRYPHNTGGAELHTEPPDYMISFPELLRRIGYFAVQAGKFHMGPYARRGFDQVNDNNMLNGDGGEELWVKCLQERPREKPFFMWFAAMDAHRPWGLNEFSGTHNPAEADPPYYLANGRGTKEDLAKYYNEIARFDHYIGLVSEELKKQGVYDNTVMIIMADNGRPFPHSKTRVNDRGLRTPFIVHWPGGIGIKPSECKALLSAIDIAPTILSIAGEQTPEQVQGRSFVRLLKNPAAKFRNFIFAEHNWHDYEAHERMVMSEDFLYILNSRPLFPQSGPADAIGSPSYI
jgi:arylsulfatase A-like enzyme